MSDKFRLLIGYDGSKFADSAIDGLKYTGLPVDCKALVLSVAEVWLPPLDDGKRPEFVTEGLRHHFEQNLEMLAKAKAMSAEAVGRLRAMFPGWSIESDATYGSPAWEIIARAGEFGADLIVVGAQGVFGLERLLIGSVAQTVVSNARCSVRVARGRIETEPAAVRIIIAYDGTSGADVAVEEVIARDWPSNTEVMVVIAHDDAIIRNSLAIGDDAIEKTGTAVVEKLRSGGLAASLSVVEGSPKHVIVEQAQRWGADSIFLGATKFDDDLTQYLLGSVASATITRAHCSIEIVRRRKPRAR